MIFQAQRNGTSLNYPGFFVIKGIMTKGFGKKTLFSAFICLCLAAAACADLSKSIDSIIGRKSLKKAKFGIKVIDAASGKTVYAHKADKPLIPASNMKIVISAAALNYLGPDYEFTTKIGMLDKTLVVIGGGDPLLGDGVTDKKYKRDQDWIFADIITALKEKKVTSIKDIVVDSTFFDDNRVHKNWPKEQLNLLHACEVSGLNYNVNCIKILTKNTGKTVTVTIQPETDYLKIINKVKPISKGNSAVGSYRHKEPNKITVHGKCRKSAGFNVAIERPAAFFGFLLAEKLNAAGINVEGQLTEKYIKKDKKIKILRVYSTKIADVLVRCNKDSLGLAAESLLKTISAENTTGRINGEWRHGLNLVSRYLRSLGIDSGQFDLDDARGLSRKNMLSPNAITQVLLDVYKSKNWQVYKNSLAVGGIDGTMHKYFKETKYKGRIFAKTGYIRNTKALSGVCTTAKGDFIFSILTSGTNGRTRTAINDIAKAIIDNVQ